MDNLSKNQKQRKILLRDNERLPTWAYPRPSFGDVTIGQRLQTHQRTLSSSKIEEPQKPIQNIHMERLRGYKNMTHIFKTQAKILNHISSEAKTLSYGQARTQTQPNLSLQNINDLQHSILKLDISVNMPDSQNDLIVPRDDPNITSDQLMVIHRLVSTRPASTRPASRF